MSRFSGKCDFYDFIEINGVDKVVNETDIYAAGNILPLRIDKPEDLIPYYPYLIIFSNANMAVLSGESWVDREETMELDHTLKSLKKRYTKLLRKKLDITVANLITDESSPSYVRELAIRVAKQGDKAITDGIHTEMAEYYREKLYIEMVENGWKEEDAFRWCYGIGRWIEGME